jgi:hypothetical protein
MTPTPQCRFLVAEIYEAYDIDVYEASVKFSGVTTIRESHHFRLI